MLDACEQCGNVVGGRSLVFVHIVPNFDVSRFAWFSVVVFMVVGMCSYGELRVDSDHCLSVRRSFRCSVCCTSVCFW